MQKNLINIVGINPWLIYKSHSQASFSYYTYVLVSGPTLASLIQNLRYILEGDRPSQTATFTEIFRFNLIIKTVSFESVSRVVLSRLFPIKFITKLPLILHNKLSKQFPLAIVKVHGVFPSSYYYSASSRKVQFHWGDAWDSRKVVTSFMRDGTYPSRSFATLGPSEYSRRLPYLNQKLLTTFTMLGHRADVRPYI